MMHRSGLQKHPLWSRPPPPLEQFLEPHTVMKGGPSEIALDALEQLEDDLHVLWLLKDLTGDGEGLDRMYADGVWGPGKAGTAQFAGVEEGLALAGAVGLEAVGDCGTDGGGLLGLVDEEEDGGQVVALHGGCADGGLVPDALEAGEGGGKGGAGNGAERGREGGPPALELPGEAAPALEELCLGDADGGALVGAEGVVLWVEGVA